MSFRQFGGLNFSAKHNIVGSNYNTSNNLQVTQNVGQSNSYINFLSDISGNFGIIGSLSITGNVTAGSFTSLGNVIIDGTLSVSGATTLSSTLGVSGATTLSSTLGVSGATTLSSTLDVTGATTLSSTLDVTGATTLSSTLDVTGATTFSSTITATGQITGNTFNATSDYRIKKDIQLLDHMCTVDNLKPVSYTNILTNKQDIGLIAHELQEHYPFLVEGEKDGEKNQTVNYIGLIGILINEIKGLKREISFIKEEYKYIKNKIDYY